MYSFRNYRLACLGALVGVVLGGVTLLTQDAVARSERNAMVSSSAATISGAPFMPLQPGRLPAGTTFVIADARTHANGTTGDVDVFYRLSDGSRFHIWQTNRSPAELGPKNPLNDSGVDHPRALATWRESPGFSGRVTVVSALVRGRVVSIDAKLPVDELLQIAESLR